APFRWECWLDTAAQICAKMEWSGLKAPEILRFPDGKRLSPSELNLDGKTSATNRHALPFERRRNGWPESLIKGCTLRGKLEAISYLLASNLSDEENDKLLDLLTTLWFETGTWF
ncbi:MAG TPA: hypothetical protein VEZ90_13705, partial [Blastocatellia bacterium]|nr:hypothetical protein [Blastocatellia bacterium]